MRRHITVLRLIRVIDHRKDGRLPGCGAALPHGKTGSMRAFPSTAVPPKSRTAVSGLRLSIRTGTQPAVPLAVRRPGWAV
jgi:hypothetical protein